MKLISFLRNTDACYDLEIHPCNVSSIIIAIFCRRSGSVSAAMTGNGGGPRRSRAGSVRHHSYHHHPSHSPRSGSKGRISRGGSTSSDPTAGSPSNPVPPGGSVDLSVTPQLSPRLFPPAQKSPGSKTSSIAVGGDDVVTLPHAAEDSSLIELQQYIEQHPGNAMLSTLLLIIINLCVSVKY